MKYNLAFKYRIYPNKEQELLINKTFGCVRFVYNTILYIANKIYEETGKNKIINPNILKNFFINTILLHQKSFNKYKFNKYKKTEIISLLSKINLKMLYF